MTADGWTAVLAYSLIAFPFVATMIGSFLWVVWTARRADIPEFYGDTWEGDR